MCKAGRPVVASPLSEATNYTAGGRSPLSAERHSSEARPAPMGLVRRAEASVDIQDVAGYIVSRAGREKDRGAGDLRWLTPASCRRASRHPGGEFRIRNQRRIHVSLEES